jgi:hypothetical protein
MARRYLVEKRALSLESTVPLTAAETDEIGQFGLPNQTIRFDQF